MTPQQERAYLRFELRRAMRDKRNAERNLIEAKAHIRKLVQSLASLHHRFPSLKQEN